jgi:hypothetical protein
MSDKRNPTPTPVLRSVDVKRLISEGEQRRAETEDPSAILRVNPSTDLRASERLERARPFGSFRVRNSGGHGG